MAPILFKEDVSPPSRGVLLTIKALGLKVDFKDVPGGEGPKPEFVKIHPQQTVPTLKDRDLTIWDSHAISCYLINKYAKGSSLYPGDPNVRAVVDQRLHFDTAVVFPLFVKLALPIFKKETKTPMPQAVEETHETYGFLEEFLADHDWLAGENVTIADFSIIAVVSAIDVLVPLASDKYPRTVAWMSRCRTLPYYESGNQLGLDKFKAHFKTLME